MQHVDHDMDDLLRKAAEDYPLKTELDDWDKLAGKMEFAPVAPVAGAKGAFKYYSPILIVIAFLMVLSGLYYYDITHLGKAPKAEHLKSSIDPKESVTFKKQEPTIVGPVKPEDKVVVKETVTPAEKNIVTREQGTKANRYLPTNVRQGNNKGITKTFPDSKLAYGKQGRSLMYSKDLENNKGVTRAGSDNKFTNSQEGQSLAYGRDSGHTALPLSESDDHLKSAIVKNLPPAILYSISERELHQPPVKLSTHYQPNQKGFYLAVNGGPEFSKVGSQSSTRMGYHAGVLIGYRLNSNWSVESGVLMGEDKYYSNGSYFSMSKIASSMPVGMEILTIDGQTKHLEIPVIAKYNFLQRRQSAFFFTGGILSDVYLQEKNHYQTMLNGVKDNQMGVYDQNRFTLASQLRISIGYEHPLGRSGSFRVEPYKNIPLQKMGMGSMAVFSSGFNVSLVHFLGK